VIPSKGSVGASGDLAPLAHLALCVIGEGEAQAGDQQGKKRRRRRRGGRGRGRNREGLDAAMQVGITPQSAQVQAGAEEDEEEFEDEEDAAPQAPQTHVQQPAHHMHPQPAQQQGDGTKRRRRRRRRGRGGQGNGEFVQQGQQGQHEQQPPMQPQDRTKRFEPLTGSLPVSPSVPDRHVFRVDPEGKAHATGRTAPREPSRAIAVRGSRPPAVDAPPPHLTLPRETPPKATKPARGRRATSSGIARELEATHMAALPPPKDEKPKRVTRKKAEQTGDAETKPKRAPAKKKAEVGAVESGVKKTSARKKSATAVARKKKA